MKRLACAFVLAGTAGLLVGTVHDAHAARRAQNGLQLSILTPDPSSIGDQMSLDVICKGGVLDTIELYLDGTLVAKRQIGTSQTRNIVSFRLETLQFSTGDHAVVVKAYGTDGKPISATSRVRIPALDLNAPVRIAYPETGTQVSGTVPVRLSLSEQMLAQKPYVTFFVDREFKVLRNTPPYEYIWDTSRVNNGWHILEAWSQTASAISPTRARPVHVNVNNGGGETRRLDKIADLRAEQPGINLKVDPSTARSGAGTAAVPGMVAGPAGSVRLSGVKPGTGEDLRTAEPSGQQVAGVAAAPGEIGVAGGGASVTLSRPNPRPSGGAAKQPAGTMAIASLPGGGTPSLPNPEALIPVISRVSTSGAPGTVATKPGETIESVSKRTGVSVEEIARLNNVRPGARLKGGSLIVPRAGAFDIAFDGTRIAFDVQPRVQDGMPIAPFRQIFEHTGGRLYWFHDAKTVRAINDRREIEIKVGKANATVNGQALFMERIPFIEMGRTIVPLTFIRDSMDVKVLFNKKTGRLLIESRK